VLPNRNRSPQKYPFKEFSALDAYQMRIQDGILSHQMRIISIESKILFFSTPQHSPTALHLVSPAGIDRFIRQNEKTNG
jgi:hypothetical protein